MQILLSVVKYEGLPAKYASDCYKQMGIIYFSYKLYESAL